MSSNGNGNGHEEFDAEGGKQKPPAEPLLPIKFDPRCKVCSHGSRRIIERLAIMPNISYSHIGETFSVDRRSVSNHVKKHLNFEEESVRRIIEDEAQKLEADVEEGVKGALSRRVFLSAYIQKSLEALLTGAMELTGKDAMNAILLSDKLDQMSGGAAVEQVMIEFNAIVQAIREISQYDFDKMKSPQDLQTFILNRSQALAHRAEEQRQLEE